MADNPLVTFWNDTLTQAKADKTTADAQLTAAQNDLKAKRDALATATSATKAAQQKIADIRAKLAAIPTGDDGAALLAQFRQATLDAHQAQGKQLAAEDDVARAAAASATASSAVSAAAARVSAAAAALNDSQQQATIRNGLKDTAARPPLDTLKADAGKAATSPPFTDAQKRIQADFPADLLKAAEARFQAELARLRRTRAASDTAEDLVAAGDTSIATARVALTRAVAALQDTTQNAVKNLTQSNATLTRVADTNQLKLTDEEKTAIQGLKPDGTPDDAINRPRSDAAKAAAALADAQHATDDAQAAVDNARLKARANGTDPAKVDDDVDVKKALADLQTATDARNTADTDFTADQRKTMSAWAATIPDANWQLLADFETAHWMLGKLAATDPAAQEAAVTAAENALVTALQNANAGPLLVIFVRSEGARRSSLRDSAADAFARRALSAMRNDF